MIRGVIYMGAGFVAGYCISRAIEARAHGVPFSVAFQLSPEGMLTPIIRLAQARAVAARPINVQPVAQLPAPDPDAPMQPAFVQDAEIAN